MKTVQEAKKCEGCGESFLATFDINEATGNPLWVPRLCPSCAETSAQAEKRRQEEEREAAITQRWEKLCPSEFLHADASRLPHLSEVLAWERGKKGLLLLGKSGMGKTRCIWKLLRPLFWDGITPVVFTEVGFSIECARVERNRSADEFIEKLVRAPILFLDDIGHAATSSKHLERLYYVVDERTKWNRPILATTQFNGEELQDKSGDRHQKTVESIVRRLREFCTPIEFTKPPLPPS